MRIKYIIGLLLSFCITTVVFAQSLYDHHYDKEESPKGLLIGLDVDALGVPGVYNKLAYKGLGASIERRMDNKVALFFNLIYYTVDQQNYRGTFDARHLWTFSGEGRYYFRQTFQGLYAGARLTGGSGTVSFYDPYYGIMEENFISGDLGLGYAFLLSPKLNLNFGAHIGSAFEGNSDVGFIAMWNLQTTLAVRY